MLFMNQDLFNKLLIFRMSGIGPVKYRELIEGYGGAETAVEELRLTGDLLDSVRREIDLAEKLGIEYIDEDSEMFPAAYKNAKNHSPIISVRGNLKTLGKKAVAMVGTRHATAAGMAFMSNLAREFASRGYAVVSGMAMGTDAAAHRGALAADGDSLTLAGVAGGADYIWPPENENLYHEIVERGAVISDMPVGFVPARNNFIVRNRMVAGLADMLILGEADEKSGSVATAKFILELSRPLWAVPSHPSDERSAGPNGFIKRGEAKLCNGASDFFETPAEKDATERSKDASASLLDFIGNVPVSENVLTGLAKKHISEIAAELVRLELAGEVKKVDGGFVRA